MERYAYWGFATHADYQRQIDEYFAGKKIEAEIVGRQRAEQELAFRDFMMSEKSKKCGNSGKKVFWVTINPKPDISLNDIKKNTVKMYSKKWINSYMYVYETTDKNHMHTHGLIVADYEVSRARKELSNTASAICDTSNVHCFKFVVLDDPDVIQQKINYMQGLKQDKKNANVEITKQWRTENNLAELYDRELSILLALGRKSEDNKYILCNDGADPNDNI